MFKSVRRERELLVVEIYETHQVINFNTIAFEQLLTSCLDNHENLLEVIYFSFEKLNQIKEFDDYFLKSVELTLKLFLESKINEATNEFFSYVRKFLHTYKPALNGSKQAFYIVILKILIKFANNSEDFLVCLLDNGLYEPIISIIRYISDNGINRDLTETLAYSIHLLFKLSINEKYFEMAFILPIKSLIMKYLEGYLRNPSSSVYFEHTSTIVLSCVLFLFNNISNKEKIDDIMLNELIKLCDQLVFQNEDESSFRIIKNDIVDGYEYIRFFRLYDCLVSIKRFVSFMQLNRKIIYPQFLERFNKFLEVDLGNTKYNQNSVTYEKYVCEILSNNKALDFDKFCFVINYECEFKNRNATRFDELAEFILTNCFYDSCKHFYDNTSVVFDQLVSLLETRFNKNLMIFIFKIFIRKCILNSKFLLNNRHISTLFLCQEFGEKFSNFIKYFFKIEKADRYSIERFENDFILSKIEIYELINTIEEALFNNEKFFENILEDLFLNYNAFKSDNEKIDCLFSIKVQLEIVNKYGYKSEKMNQFLNNFTIRSSFIDFDYLLKKLLNRRDTQSVFVSNCDKIIDAFVSKKKLDFQKLANIFSISDLKSLLTDQNIEKIKMLLEVMIQCLRFNYENSEKLYLKESINYFDAVIEIVSHLASMTIRLRDSNKLLELIIFLVFKIHIRKSLLDYESTWLLPEYLLKTIESKQMQAHLVIEYFTNTINDVVIRTLVQLINNPAFEISKSDSVFEFNTFEIYEYLNFLFKKNLSNELSELLKIEFFDKKCLETLMKHLVNKTDIYNQSEQLGDILEIKAILKLILNFYKRFNLPLEPILTKFLTSFKSKDNQHVNIMLLVDELLAIFNKKVVIPEIKIKKEEPINVAQTIILEKLIEERAKYLKTIADISNYEFTRQRFDQILENLKKFAENESKFSDQFITKLEELDINKLFYHLIKFYFEFYGANLIENLNSLLEIILILVIKFSESKDYLINSYQNHNEENAIDILDLLISSILFDDKAFLMMENSKNLKIIQLFMHLLFKLAISSTSKEILKLKFKKFKLYYDFFQRLSFYKKYSCVNLVFMLLANLIDKPIFKELINSETGAVNNTVVNQIKSYLKGFLHSIVDTFFNKPEIHKSGVMIYNLTEKINGCTIDCTCYLHFAIQSFGNFIESDLLLQQYLCYLCLENDECLKMFSRIIQYSAIDEEKLEAIRFVWLLVKNNSIASSLKNDAALIDYLKEYSDNHRIFNIRTYSGAILWNIFTKHENKPNKSGNNKRDLNDENNIDTSFIKLSVQESETHFY